MKPNKSSDDLLKYILFVLLVLAGSIAIILHFIER